MSKDYIEMEEEHKSRKSNSVFIAKGRKERAFLIVYGEASTLPKVTKEVARIQVQGGDFATVNWIARQFSNTF